MDNDVLYKIALSCIPGIGSQTVKQLLASCGSPQNIFKAKPGKLDKIPGIGLKTANLINASAALKMAETKLKKLEQSKTNFVFFTDHNYPDRLRQCNDSPILFFYRGNYEFNAKRIIAIVGTRNATEYGKSMTEQIVKEIKPYNPVVVSGLAYGIDITAHKAALAEELTTWAIIAGGHDKIYPSAHRKYYEEILEVGCVISEYLPDEIPNAVNFPARNRIIAGLSDGTLVVEAKEKGGALITADIANSYDREVFAVPGNIHNVSSAGCHNLIKQNKAHLITSGLDIAQLLNWDDEECSPRQTLINFDFSIEENAIISLLREKDLHIDEISWRSQMPLGALASLLLSLEMRGFIKALPGKKFRYVYA